jgi:hypothetical protein
VKELMDSTSRLCADVFAAGDAAYLQILTKAVSDAIRRGELAPKRHGLGADDVARPAHGRRARHHGRPAQPVTPDQHRRQLDALVRVVVDGLRAR